MNVYAAFILVFLLLEFALALAADALNLRHLSETLPGELAGVYDPATYARSQQYLRQNTRFSMAASAARMAMVLGFWFAGGFAWLDRATRSLDLSETLTGLLYIGALALGSGLVSTVFSIYGTFVIEERFGFNKTTARTFVADRLKALALLIVLGGPILWGILFFLSRAGNLAWLYCWITATGFSLFIQLAAPAWIMPLFNKFTPLQDNDLKSAIHSFAESVGFPLENVFVMDGSKRTAKSNAFFSGFGEKKRIALFDTLIARHTTEELVAVLAHEIGHYKKRHIWWGLLIQTAHWGVLFFLLSLFIRTQALFDAFYVKQVSVYAGLVFFGLLYTPVETLLSLAIQALSRRWEAAADRFAASNMGGPEPLIQALKKLGRDNLSNLTPHPFYVFLHYSHPPLARRIRALQALGPELASSPG